MKFLNIICVVVTKLIVVKYITAEQSLVNFKSYYYSYLDYGRQFPTIIRANEVYQVTLTKKNINTKDERVIKSSEATLEVTCKLFVSFKGKEEGIYTCQDTDRRYYVIPSMSVSIGDAPSYYGWRIMCEQNLKVIIEEEEVQMLCKIQPITNSYDEGYLTIGWIQGEQRFLQTFTLHRKAISFYQKFIGYYSGEGLFFYCHKTTTTYHCYTLILNVLSRLKVQVQSPSKNSEISCQHCFKCQATGGSDEKVHNWNLNGLELISKDNKTDICLSNLTAGRYSIECLVSTNAQNRSGVIEFTVKEEIPSDTIPTSQTATQHTKTTSQTTTQQGNQDTKTTSQTTTQQGNHDNITRDLMSTETRTTPQSAQLDVIDVNEHKKYVTMVRILAATTILLVFVVLILVYFLFIRKHGSPGLQTVMYNQRGVDICVPRASEVSQINADDEVTYHTLEDPSAELTENDYVNGNFTHYRNTCIETPCDVYHTTIH